MRPKSRPIAPLPPASADTRPSRTFAIAGTLFQAPKPEPGLYLAATPIGNLGDITLRALETLAGADLIACEDTRVTRKLVDHYAIGVPLTPYHDHNAAQARPKLLAHLAQGAVIVLVSDAGTPLISDPGYKLVRAAQESGHPVHTLPGASSVLAALTLAGLPTDRFFFEGFLPAKELARRARARELARIDATVVAFESGPRLAQSLIDLATVLGDRDIAICRELTKVHEEVRRGRLADVAAQTDDLETRGEFVLVIGPPVEQTLARDDLDTLLRQALAQASLKDAVAQIADATGHSKRDIYARALVLAKERGANSADSDDA